MKPCWKPTYWLPFSLLVAAFAVALSAVLAVSLWTNGSVDQPDRTLFLSILIPAGAFLGFRYQRILDRRTEAYKTRKELFFEYAEARTEFMGNPTTQNVTRLNAVANKLRIMCGGQTWKNLERHQYNVRRVSRIASNGSISEKMLSCRFEAFVFGKLIDAMRIDLENQINFFKGHGSVRLGDYRMLKWKSYDEAYQESLPRRLRNKRVFH